MGIAKIVFFESFLWVLRRSFSLTVFFEKIVFFDSFLWVLRRSFSMGIVKIVFFDRFLWLLRSWFSMAVEYLVFSKRGRFLYRDRAPSDALDGRSIESNVIAFICQT